MHLIRLGVTVTAIAACGGGETDGDDDSPVDAPSTVDGPPPIDGPPACAKPAVYVNALPGGDTLYTRGPTDSRTNSLSILDASATVGPMAVDHAAAVIATIRPVLDPYGVQLTAVDPTPVPHLEIVLVGTGWPFPASAGAVPPFSCTSLVPNAIAMVNGRLIGNDPGALASSVLFSINAIAGVEPVNAPASNCGSMFPQPPSCAYANDAPIDNSRCGRTDVDQIELIQTRLGCP
jgi:hypothetical protein